MTSDHWQNLQSSHELDQEEAYAHMSTNFEAHRKYSLPYYKWISSKISPLLGKRILELGAGNGLLTSMVEGYDFYIATDSYPPCVDELKAKTANKKNMVVKCLDVGEKNFMASLNGYHIDTVLSSNLLEHIEDDVRFLKTVNKFLPANGRIVSLVPAFRHLYGSMDSAVGHFRRYEKRELTEKMEDAGFIAKKVFYFNFPGYLSWYFSDRILGYKNTTGGQFRMFNMIVPLFRCMEAFASPPFGSSIIAVGEKPS